jgi:putative ABC transport system substrate-binding protein
MRRREFITLLGGAAAAWPLAARARQSTLPAIGILGSATVETWAYLTAHFMQGLKETGFVEGQNVAIESRWANDRYDQLPGLAADLVSRRVSLIAAIGNRVSLAARYRAGLEGQRRAGTRVALPIVRGLSCSGSASRSSTRACCTRSQKRALPR